MNGRSAVKRQQPIAKWATRFHLRWQGLWADVSSLRSNGSAVSNMGKLSRIRCVSLKLHRRSDGKKNRVKNADSGILVGKSRQDHYEQGTAGSIRRSGGMGAACPRASRRRRVR